MRKVSWLVAGTVLLLSIALMMGCGYAKKDEVEKQLADQGMKSEQGIKLAQDAAAEASEKADKSLAVAREEIAKAKEESMNDSSMKNAETLAAAKSGIEAGDKAVSADAAKAAAKALADSKAYTMSEDEKVRKEAKGAADKAMSAAEEADRKAAQAAREAELAKELPKPKKSVVFTVYFDLGQTKIKKESMAELEKAAQAIKSHFGDTVKIEGHTDNVPVVKSTRYKNNWGLSQARAEAVKKYLVDDLGVSADSISETIGMAFYKPVAPNSPAARKNNRRVEITIVPAD